MTNFEDLRVCVECGTIFAKHTADRIILQCPNCKSPRRDKIEFENPKTSGTNTENDTLGSQR